MRIAVTGASGRLGGRLVEVLSREGHDVLPADQAEFDITDRDATRAWINAARPEIVLHPAAWTDVDGCAREPRKAFEINGYGAMHVAQAAQEVRAPILYVSSNEVFDGRKRSPYVEHDTPLPVNPYGKSKWLGEQTVKQANARHYIVRTAWLFAHGGKNFIQSILNAARAGKPLRVVTDEVANPTYTDDLAEAIAQLIKTERYGVYHLVNEGYCSRYDFARFVLDNAGFADTPIQPITSKEWSRPSTPPDFSALENQAGRKIGVTLRPWQDAVLAFLEKEGLMVR